jgi:hypothetical protein
LEQRFLDHELIMILGLFTHNIVYNWIVNAPLWTI